MKPGESAAFYNDAPDKTSGLIGWWNFADGTSEDVSGFGNHGVGAGTKKPWASDGVTPNVDGGPSTWLQYDGTTSSVGVPSFSYSGATFSASLWINFAANQVNDGRLVSNSHTDADNNGFQILLTASTGRQIVFSIGNGTTFVQTAGAASLALGVPHHVLCTFNAGTLTVYVDGVSYSSATGVSTMSAGASTLAFGWAAAYSGDNYAGQIGDVRLFNTALTAADAWDLYASGLQTQPPEGEFPALFVSAGGGNVLTASVTEAATAADSESVAAVFASAATEAAAATDAETTALTTSASLTEAGSASDTDAASAIFAASDTEAASASDSNATGQSAGTTEAGSATDTETAVLVANSAIAEAGAATDQVSASAIFAASDTEAASASDTNATGQSGSTTEAATATDTETTTAVFAASTVEAGAATDSASATAIYAAAGLEAATASDTDAGAATFAVADTEAGTATDSADAALGNQTYSVSITEAASAADVIDFQVPNTGWDGTTVLSGGSGVSRKRFHELLEEIRVEKEAAKPSPAKAAVKVRAEVKEAATKALGLLDTITAPKVAELVVKVETAPRLDLALNYAKQALELIQQLEDEEDEDIIMMLALAA